MIAQMLYLLPSIVCLLWFFSFAMKVKTRRQKLFMWIQGINAFHFATYALYMTPHDDYYCMVVMNSVNIPLCLAMLAMVVLFTHMLHSDVKLSPWHLVSLLPSVVLGTVVNLSHCIIGMDNAQQMVELHDQGIMLPAYDTPLHHMHDLVVYHLFSLCCIVFFAIIAVECIVVLRKGGYQWGDAMRFFFKGKKTTSERAIALLYLVQIAFMLPLTVMGRPFMIEHNYLGIASMLAIAIIKHCACHVVYYSDTIDYVSLYDLSHVKPSCKASTGSIEPVPAHKRNMLIDKINRLMEDERLYLNEDLTLADMCQRLAVGRTTLSSVINQQYGIPFRELVNRYRVNAAKAYMLAHPTATQEAVASECGFKNAPSLNRKFKEIEGDTPLAWLMHHNKVS